MSAELSDSQRRRNGASEHDTIPDGVGGLSRALVDLRQAVYPLIGRMDSMEKEVRALRITEMQRKDFWERHPVIAGTLLTCAFVIAACSAFSAWRAAGG